MNSKITIDAVIEAMSSDGNLGFCLECGAEASGVEPDARNYKCDACGQMQVFGAEEILVQLIP